MLVCKVGVEEKNSNGKISRSGGETLPCEDMYGL